MCDSRFEEQLKIAIGETMDDEELRQFDEDDDVRRHG